MNVIEKLRQQVVVNGAMRFGSQSKLAQLLGCSQDVVRKIVLGSRELTGPQIVALRDAFAQGVPLFTVKAPTQLCDEPGCKGRGYAKGKCRSHYYLMWKRAMKTV